MGILLTSEITTGGGGMRVVDKQKFENLLADPKVKASELLTAGVVKAAQAVQLEAIRKNQLKIAQELFKKQDPQGWRDSIGKFEALIRQKYRPMDLTGKEELIRDDINFAHHDLNGIGQIANEASVQLAIPDPKSLDPIKDKFLLLLIADLQSLQNIALPEERELVRENLSKMENRSSNGPIPYPRLAVNSSNIDFMD